MSKKIISKTIGMAAAASMLFTNTYTMTRAENTVQEESTAGEDEKIKNLQNDAAPEKASGASSAPEEGEKAEVSPAPAEGETEAPEVSPAPAGGEDPEVSPVPTEGEDPEVSPAPAGGETPEVSPAPTEGEDPEVSPAPIDKPEVSVTPVPSETPASKGAPKLLSLTPCDSASSLEKLSPAFSPDVYVYHFMDTGYYGRVRTMKATVDTDVAVTVNGEEVPVDEKGVCTLKILYSQNGSENDVVLTRKDTGESQSYQFHTYPYGVKNYSTNYRLVDVNGNEDSKNISSVKANDYSNVYDATVNLDKVRLCMTVSPGENEVFQAELVDKNGKKLDDFLMAGEENGESVVWQSKPMTLEEGENTFYLKCYGNYDQFVNGKHEQGPGVFTVAFRIYRNKAEDTKVNTNTELEDMELYINGVSGKNYIENFTPDKRTYKVSLSVKDFDEALASNDIYFKLKEGDAEQKIKVYGGSTLHGISMSDKKRQDNGGYKVASYSADDMYSADSFSINVKITASDNITNGEYTIVVQKAGKSGMLIPDIYKSSHFIILPSQPERTAILVLASIKIYNDGELTLGSNAISSGKMYIEIQNPDIISIESKSGSGYTVKMNNPGTTKVNVIYDNGKNHFEEQIQVSNYYSPSGLVKEINIAQDLLDSTQNSDRIYEEGAKDVFSAAITTARKIYVKYVNTTLDDQRYTEVTNAVIELQKAEDAYRRSEIGKKITAFLPLADDIKNQNVQSDSSILNVKRPKTLEAIIDGQQVTISGISWTSRPEWQVHVDEKVIYRFTPVLPAGYVVMDGVDYPVITVNRKPKGLPVEVKRTIPLDESVLVQHVPYGTRKSALNFPQYLEMYRQETTGEEGGRISVPVRWKDVDGYNGENPGSYTFRSVINALPSDFTLAKNTTQDPMQTITIIVDPPKEDGNDGGNGGGDNDDNGSGNGNGNGTGQGSGNGQGSGTGKGQGSGNGSGKGTSNKKGNGKNSGNGGKSAKGDGGAGNENKSTADNTSGEASGTEKNTEETAGGFQNQDAAFNEGESKASEMKGSNGSKNSISQTDSAGESENKKNNSDRWKVAEIVKDTVDTHAGELIFMGILLVMLLIMGGYREYRRHRDDRKEK